MNLLSTRPARVRGQGMTEYIIIVALIAIAAIATTTFFGSTVRNQVAGMAAGLAGNQGAADSAQTRATAASRQGAAEANQGRGLNNFSERVAAPGN